MNRSLGVIAEIDVEFEHAALSARNTVWAVEGLSEREKVLLSVGNDVCSGALDISLDLHVRLAIENGVSFDSLRETARHLAPYCGYPRSLTALARIAELEKRFEPFRAGADSTDEPAFEALETLKMLAAVAGPLNTQVQRTWRRPYLSIKERALLALLSDVQYATLGLSFNVHLDIAYASGLTREKIEAVFRFISGFGISRAADAREALRSRY